MSGILRVTYRVSSIAHNRKQKETVRSLGLRHLNQQVELPDRPEVRAMLRSVPHLVSWEEASVANASQKEERA